MITEIKSFYGIGSKEQQKIYQDFLWTLNLAERQEIKEWRTYRLEKEEALKAKVGAVVLYVALMLAEEKEEAQLYLRKIYPSGTQEEYHAAILNYHLAQTSDMAQLKKYAPYCAVSNLSVQTVQEIASILQNLLEKYQLEKNMVVLPETNGLKNISKI